MCGTLPFPILFVILCTVPYLHVQFYPMIFDRSGNPVGFGDGLHGLHRLLRSWNPSPRLRHKQMVGCSPMGLGDFWADAGIEIYRYLHEQNPGNDPSILATLHRFDDKVERFFPISQQTKMHQKLCQICHFLEK